MMEQSNYFNEPENSMDADLPGGPLKIKTIGIGGAGTNAVDRMKLEDLEQVHLVAIDTDSQVLASSPVEETFLLGRSVTMGKSTGGSVDKGRAAAEHDIDTLRQLVRGIDLLFIVTGLGGGTGGGAAPVIAELAASEGALVIAFTALPFQREGNTRCTRAAKALEQVQKHCHAVITLPNDVIFKQVDESATLMEAFEMADKWIRLGVQSIWSMLFNTGLINVDFSTLQSALPHPGGKTLFGTGSGEGEDFVRKAIEDLETCPLLHLPEAGFMRDTDQLIVNLTGGPDLTMSMVNQVMDVISEMFGCRNSIVMGASIDGSFYNRLRITVMGTFQKASTGRSFAPVPAASIPPNEPLKPPQKELQEPELIPIAAGLGGRAQEEFAFPRQEENRGFFEKTQRNLYEGVDLDIPTYLRRGIKLPKG